MLNDRKRTILEISPETVLWLTFEPMYRTKNHLDKMNEKFFEPRGLFAVIMTFNPGHSSPVYSVDQSADYSEIPGYEGMELPESAPLIFPSMDEINASRPGNQSQGVGQVAAGYFDRRSQAEFVSLLLILFVDSLQEHSTDEGQAQKNPDSALAMQDVQFASRWGDPNHPANKGGLIALVSGGTMGRQRRDKREMRENRERRREARGRPRRTPDPEAAPQRGISKTAKAKLMGKVWSLLNYESRDELT
jgi:hypothetical protein